MRAEVVSIGNELLLGLTVNTNAAWIGRELRDAGYRLGAQRTVVDEKRAIQEAISEAMARSEIVIVTGGLGPTIDDLTLDAARPLFQASEEAIENLLGSAEGAHFQEKGKSVYFLPGVPREMEAMFSRFVLPSIQKKHPPEEKFIHTFSLCFFKEMEINPYLEELQREFPEISCGIYPARGTLQIVLESRSPVEAIGKKLEEKFSTFVYHTRKIEEAVHEALIRKKEKLALAESCTGGLVSARLTALPDASYYLLGSAVVYSNDWKQRFLGVETSTLDRFGAVSREVVEEMLQGLFARTEADYAVAISGIAGPKGGAPEKPVGTVWIGVGKRGERSDIGVVQGGKDRLGVIDFSTQTALGALYRRIVYNEPSFT